MASSDYLHLVASSDYLLRVFCNAQLEFCISGFLQDILHRESCTHVIATLNSAVLQEEESDLVHSQLLLEFIRSRE